MYEKWATPSDFPLDIYFFEYLWKMEIEKNLYFPFFLVWAAQKEWNFLGSPSIAST